MRAFRLEMHLGGCLNGFKPNIMAVFSITKYLQTLKITRSTKSSKIVLVRVGEM